MSWSEKPENETYDGMYLTDLSADQYYIYFNSSLDHAQDLRLFIKNEECYKCPYTPYSNRGIVSSFASTMSSKWKAKWQIYSTYLNETVCAVDPDVGEFGVYQLDIDKDNCTLYTLLEPVNIYLSILSTLLIVFGIMLALYFCYWIYNKQNRRQEKNNDVPEKIKKRVLSLDTFRGISITIMVFVNYGGGGYNFIEHAPWNGLQIADLVFPCFLWIMGVCIPIAIRSALRRDEDSITIFKNIFRRSCILFLLGLALNFSFTIQEMRIFGVLQRFALCYFFVATLNLIFTKKDEPNIKSKIFKDIIILFWQWVVVLIVLTIHTAITFGMEYLNCPAGYLGPGGLHEFGQYENCTGGVTGYIDSKILGFEHMYQFGTARQLYGGTLFDPEGPFGTLTSIVQVFLGVQAGVIIQVHKSHKNRIIKWLLWGTITGLVGGALCGFSQEDGVIPVNKNLWSLSFVLVTSSFAFILLTICYVVIDMFSFWSGRPFIFAGMNAIIMYVGHTIATNMFPFQWRVTANPTHFQDLIRATWGTISWLVVAYWLYRKKFFLSI